MAADQTQEDAALAVAWRVAQASPLFTTEAQVLSLARQIAAFAEGLPIVVLPVQGNKRSKVKNEEE
jgi:hypothetical protein